MRKIHEKSLCCRGYIRRFGERRRQCKVCKRTWRVWKKIRGRKKKRATSSLAYAYLRHETPSIYARARKYEVHSDKMRNQLIRSRDVLLKNTSWPRIPKNIPLIAVADAMVQFFERQKFTFFFMLLRPLNTNYAFAVPPLIVRGHEDMKNWELAFSQLPSEVSANIKALVCDGHQGLIMQARNRGWLIQRCHFHLLANIQSFCSIRALGRHRALGIHINELVRAVLVGTRKKEIDASLAQLAVIARKSFSRTLKTTLSGFIKNHRDYRTYRRHRKLNLPHTTNSLESLISGVRSLCFRARGFRTCTAMTKWVHAHLKSKQRFTCNGFFQPN